MKKYKFQKAIFIKILLIIALIFVHIILFVANAELLAVFDGNLSYYNLDMSFNYLMLSFVFMMIVLSLFYFIFGNLFYAFISTEVFSLIFGLVNRVLFRLRYDFLTLPDLFLARQATKIHYNVIDFLSYIEIILIVIAICLGVLDYKVLKKYNLRLSYKNYKHNIVRVVGVLFLVFIFYDIFNIEYPKIVIKNLNNMNSKGTVCTFCNSIFDMSANSESIDANGLFADAQDRYLNNSKTNCSLDENHPNIIVIMSEAFWTLDSVSNKNEAINEVIEKYNIIKQKGVAGNVAVNVYGGGTNTSEFEFLTGINSKYLNISNYYESIYRFKQTALPYYLKEMGYNTIAMHPFVGEFWNRNTGYPNMYFDEYYFVDDFKYNEKYGWYISDSSLSNEIIYRFEDEKRKENDTPVFLFSVSIQNHITKLDGMERVLNASDLSWDEYCDGLLLTLDSLEYLISYFEDYDEETMIIFFGDHAPSMARDMIDESADEDSLFMTPYFIWTNYDNDYTAYGDMNLSYLSTVIMSYLNMPPTKYYYYNYEKWKAAPINTKYLQVLGDDSSFFDEEELKGLGHYIEKASKVGPMTIDFWEIAE